MNTPKISWIIVISFAIISTPLSAFYSNLNIEQAKILAQENGQNIFVDYTAEWCAPCQIFESMILSDDAILDLLETEFIWIKADYDDLESKEWFSNYKIKCMPSSLILDSYGSVLEHMMGSNSIADFYSMLKTHRNKPNDKPARLSMNSYTIPTKIEVNCDPKPEVKLSQKNMGDLIITVGAFSVYQNVVNYKAKLQKLLGVDLYIEEDSNRKLYKLNIGHFHNKEDCRSITDSLAAANIDHYLRRI